MNTEAKGKNGVRGPVSSRVCVQAHTPHFSKALHMVDALLHGVVHLLLCSEAADAKPERTQKMATPGFAFWVFFF